MNKKKRQRSLKAMLFSIGIGLNLFGGSAWAAVSGTVFQDLPVNGVSLNTYGMKDANELGVEGVTVTAYPGGFSTTTASDGTWNLATTGDVRIEFSDIPSYLKESPDAGNGNTSVQFVTDGSVVDFALHNPTNFVATNPFLATTHFVNGQETPVSGPLPTLFAWPYSNSGLIDLNQQTLADTSTARSLWGLAHSRSRNTLYASAALRRHVSIGSNGLGAIYQVDLSTNATSLLMNIPGVGSIGDDASRGLGAENTGNRDVEAFAKVAKVGLGDIELSDDESTLYVMNLFNKSIYEVDVDTATVTQSYLAPVANCTDGEARPFGLQYHQGELYVGSVCDASTANCDTSNFGQCSQLTAHVYKIPAGGTVGNEILNFRLDYEKEHVTNDGLYEGSARFWNPWTDVYLDLVINNGDIRLSHPVPVLSNIKFDEFGNMLLSFTDRTGLQGGASNLTVDGAFERYAYSGGDILKATANANGTFSIPNVEFYDDDTDVSFHEEGALGAHAMILGSNEIVFTQYDNVDAAVHTKGVSFLSVNDGSKVDAYRVADANRPAFFGKATGIGDLEILTDPAPIEIGNRVWLDANGNGVQDADENGLAGVRVRLLDNGGAEIAVATTDASGSYIFSNDPNETSTASHIYQLATLQPDTAYTVQVQNVQGASKQAVLGSNQLTTANSGEGAQADLNDSDGVLNSDDANAAVNAIDIPTAGHNNHSYDFGFRDASAIPPTSSGGCTTITNMATITSVTETDTDSSNDSSSVSIQSNCDTSMPDLSLVKRADKTRVLAGETVTFTLELTNQGSVDATGIQVEDDLPNGLTHTGNNPQQGTYDAVTGIWDVGSLTAGQTITLEIMVTVD